MRTEGILAGGRMGPAVATVKAGAGTPSAHNQPVLDVLFPILIAIALVSGALTGRLDEVGRAATQGARDAVDVGIGLLAGMVLWLGLVRVLQAGGFLAVLTRAVRPLLRRLFPDVPADHPALGFMTLNIASNAMDLGNAATPFGLKAMRELETLNPRPGVATDAMVLFVAINTASVTLLPGQVIALRAALGSSAPGSIVIPALLATLVSTAVAVLLARVLARHFPIRDEAAAVISTAEATAAPAVEVAPDMAPPVPPSRLRRWLALVFGAAVMASVLVAFWHRAHDATEGAPGWWPALKDASGGWLLPIVVAAVVLWGLGRGVAVYEKAVEGGREAFDVTLRILPYLVMILVATGMLRASGALDLLLQTVAPVAAWLHIPPEAVPMGFVRSLSGAGARGFAAELMKVHGPDSFVGNVVSVILGSTETTFYVLAVYFGAVKIRVSRHALLACLASDAVGVVASAWACRLVL